MVFKKDYVIYKMKVPKSVVEALGLKRRGMVNITMSNAKWYDLLNLYDEVEDKSQLVEYLQEKINRNKR